MKSATSGDVSSGAALVLPSLRVSGGVYEAVSLAQSLSNAGCRMRVISLWRAGTPVPTRLPVDELSSWPPRIAHAAFEYPALALAFAKRLLLSRARRGRQHHLFTHYSTLPLALMIPRNRRWWFVQDLEWMFPSRAWARTLLERLILFVAARSRLVVANEYLRTALIARGLHVEVEHPIWADGIFAAADLRPVEARSIDVLFILRSGRMKCSPMYFQVLSHLRRKHAAVRLTAVSPDQAWLDACALAVPGAEYVHSPTRAQLAELYGRSKFFLMLSEHEGFGLPPLEAMGSGCVPVCRDAGGPRAYMKGELETLLVPLLRSAADIADVLCGAIADGERWRSLSSAARAVFDAGLLATAQRRERAVAQLGDAFARGAE